MSSRRATRNVPASAKAKRKGPDDTEISKAPQKRGRRPTKKSTPPDTAETEAHETSQYFQKDNESNNFEQEMGTRLLRKFFDQDTITLSKSLLGMVLCRKLPTGEIIKATVVETEAYPGLGDGASQTSKGVATESSKALFMDPGTAYVYMTYGMYYCFNVSSKDTGGGCLFRALELRDEHYDLARKFRQTKGKGSVEEVTEFSDSVRRLRPHELANGPSKLCMVLNMNRASCDKIDMTTSEDLWLETNTDPKYFSRQFDVAESRRVGIDSTPPEARNKLYRFFVADNTSVSKAKFSDATKAKKTSKSSRKSD